MLSTAYHSQSDGQTKRINQEIGMFLRYYINYQQDDWTEWITVAEFHYNDKRHATTRQMLFVLNFGRYPWKENLKIQTEIPKLEEFLMKLQRSWKEAKCQDCWWWTSFIFIFSLLFYFYFSFILYFIFLEQLGLGFISHAVTSVTSWWQSHKTDHETWENGVEGSGIKWHHITWTTHVGLMSYTWSFRVGCTVVSTDHE